MTGKRFFNILIVVLILSLVWACSDGLRQSIIFQDEFEQLPLGSLSKNIGVSCAYLYSPGAGQKGEWTISGYGKEPGFIEAWKIKSDAEGNYLAQTFFNADSTSRLRNATVHPLISSGDSLLHDYTVEFTFKPYYTEDKCGVVFRMQDPRRYYFYGMEGNMLVIKLIDNETAPGKPFEKVLAHKELSWQAGAVYKGVVTLREDKIFTLLNDSVSMMAYDRTYKSGRFGLLSDAPADFYQLEVRILNAERRKYQKRKKDNSDELARNLGDSPQPVLWKKIACGDFGSENAIRYGDLDNDGEKDIIMVQMGLNNEGSVVPVCISAINIDGEVLWQNGKTGSTPAVYFGEVPLQIHDLNDDGWREVIWYNGKEVLIAEGKSGRIIKRLAVVSDEVIHPNKGFREGNSIFFADLQASGYDQNIILTDENGKMTAFDSNLKVLWTFENGTVAYPVPVVMPGKEETQILAGLTLLSAQGKVLWTLQTGAGSEKDIRSAFIGEHVRHPYVFTLAEKGVLFADSMGKPAKNIPAGYVFGGSIADFNREMPGLEMVTVNFWGSQGVINLYNSEGIIYKTFETVPFGSQCLPVNWKGDGEEFFLLNADPGDGGMYNGSGRLAVVFPDDGHPVSRCSTADLTGDPRDEILVWDRYGIWIYTQSDNPRTGTTYSPVRPTLHNQADFRITVSLPSWNN